MRSAELGLLAAVTFAWTSATAVGGEPAKVPAKAIEAMGFFVGQWKSENSENGEKIGSSDDRRSWTAGKHCLRVDWSGAERGIPWRAAAVAGWDPKQDALIEYWFGSRGESLVICYPLKTMKDRVWEGTSAFSTADGKTEDHPLKNGEHFADYIRRVDVPGSKFAFALRGVFKVPHVARCTLRLRLV